ncbi:MAG: hypothetical protein J6S04_07730, partial [Clostridia bacterium]|nr:hypothetical protein [Clostridia bacterium]
SPRLELLATTSFLKLRMGVWNFGVALRLRTTCTRPHRALNCLQLRRLKTPYVSEKQLNTLRINYFRIAELFK